MLIVSRAVLTGQKMLRDHWPEMSDAFSILKRCCFLLYFHELHFFFFFFLSPTQFEGKMPAVGGSNGKRQWHLH